MKTRECRGLLVALGVCVFAVQLQAQPKQNPGANSKDPKSAYAHARNELEGYLEGNSLQSSQAELVRELLDVLTPELLSAPTSEQIKYLELWSAEAAKVLGSKRLAQIAALLPKTLPSPPTGAPPPPGGGPVAANCTCRTNADCGANEVCGPGAGCTQVPACGAGGMQTCTGRCVDSSIGPPPTIPTLSTLGACILGVGMLVIGLVMLKRGAPGM